MSTCGILRSVDTHAGAEVRQQCCIAKVPHTHISVVPTWRRTCAHYFADNTWLQQRSTLCVGLCRRLSMHASFPPARRAKGKHHLQKKRELLVNVLRAPFPALRLMHLAQLPSLGVAYLHRRNIRSHPSTVHHLQRQDINKAFNLRNKVRPRFKMEVVGLFDVSNPNPPRR